MCAYLQFTSFFNVQLGNRFLDLLLTVFWTNKSLVGVTDALLS